jgi:hypothetical protein
MAIQGLLCQFNFFLIFYETLELWMALADGLDGRQFWEESLYERDRVMPTDWTTMISFSHLYQDPELGFINCWALEGSSTPAPEKVVVIGRGSRLPCWSANDIQRPVLNEGWPLRMLKPRGRLIVFGTRILLARVPHHLGPGLQALVLGCFLRKQDLAMDGT